MKWGGAAWGRTPQPLCRRRGAVGGRLREVCRPGRLREKSRFPGGELADGITGSEPAGTKHKIRPAH